MMRTPPHWFSCGQTRPQAAGSMEGLADDVGTPTKLPLRGPASMSERCLMFGAARTHSGFLQSRQQFASAIAISLVEPLCLGFGSCYQAQLHSSYVISIFSMFRYQRPLYCVHFSSPADAMVGRLTMRGSLISLGCVKSGPSTQAKLGLRRQPQHGNAHTSAR